MQRRITAVCSSSTVTAPRNRPGTVPRCRNWSTAVPGRAGGGEELGGMRAVRHFMQRTALEGSPAVIAALVGGS